MTELEDKINLDKIVFDDNNQERKSRFCLGQTCSRSIIVFLSQFFVILLIILVAFGEFVFQNIVTNPLFGWKFCVVKQDTSHPHQDYEQVNIYKKLHIYIVGRSLRDEKVINHLRVAQKWNLPSKILQMLLFCQHSQTRYDVMQKEIANLQFVQGVDFEFIDSLRNNGRKDLSIFDVSSEETQNSKAFVDIVTASRYRGLSTNYFRQPLFHQSKLGRDVELLNMNIVFLKSSRDVMQVRTLSAQLELGSELADSYRDATSVLYGHLFIDLSPRHRRLITLLYKHQIKSLKHLYPGSAETAKKFGR